MQRFAWHLASCILNLAQAFQAGLMPQVFKAVALLERESHTKGYTESIIDTNDEHGHEAYTNR